MSKIDFPLQEGLDVQAEQLAEWKLKLTSDLYDDLVVYANTDKENWSDGHDVKRGSTLDCFIGNWVKGGPFELADELEKMYRDLDGDEINGLIFIGQQVMNGAVHLSFKINVPSMKAVNIFVTPFDGVDGITFAIQEKRVFVPCARPTSHDEFAEWKKFYIGQLVVVQGKFASVKTCAVDYKEKTLTVEGFLVPKQTVSFEENDEWGSLEDFNGNSLVDWHFSLDEELNFEIVDYNYILDAKEGHTSISLDDTANWGLKSHSHRDYRCCENVFVVSELHPLTDNILGKFEVEYEGSGICSTETQLALDELIRDAIDKMN